jgi:hypothetical protein
MCSMQALDAAAAAPTLLLSCYGMPACMSPPSAAQAGSTFL